MNTIFCGAALILLYFFSTWLFNKVLLPGELSKRAQRLAVLWGFFGATIIALAIQILMIPVNNALYSDPKAAKVFDYVIVGPVSEEFAKFLFPLAAIIFYQVRNVRVIFVLAALSGLGFHLLESSISLMNAAELGNKKLVHQLEGRIIAIAMMHSFANGIIGIGVGLSLKLKNKLYILLCSLASCLPGVLSHFWMNSLGLLVNDKVIKSTQQFAHGRFIFFAMVIGIIITHFYIRPKPVRSFTSA